MAFKTNLETPEAEAARLAQAPEGSTNHALSSMPVNLRGNIQDLMIELPSFEGDPEHTIVVVPFESYFYGGLDDERLPRRRYNFGWSCIVVASDHPRYPVGGHRVSLPEYQLRRGTLRTLALPGAMIPANAVEAAAKAHYEIGLGSWDAAHADTRSVEIDDMRIALEAAAPHLYTPKEAS